MTESEIREITNETIRVFSGIIRRLGPENGGRALYNALRELGGFGLQEAETMTLAIVEIVRQEKEGSLITT